EIDKLRLGAGDEFAGEGILAVTKALLESGVAYIGGYQGSPISHLMDVLTDAQEVLGELDVHFETSANEATAAAMAAASVNYPLRGAIAFKSVVGTNVASDALANLASGGVTGGVVFIVGEDYGEGSSIMQERTHAFAMKSQMWLIDPPPNVPDIVQAVKDSFELSEASNTPVFLELRIRSCHVYGRFKASNNCRPSPSLRDAVENPRRDVSRIVLPPASFQHEHEKIEQRWPAAIEFIQSRALNKVVDGIREDLGIIVQGGLRNSLIRTLERVGLADAFGTTSLPLYVMNVSYPIVPAEIRNFCKGKRAVLLFEEGQPNFIEQGIQTILREAESATQLVGKGSLPLAGEYTSVVLRDGIVDFMARFDTGWTAPTDPRESVLPLVERISPSVPDRPPGLCTGCPERPVFTSIKLLQKELGDFHISADIGCHLFSILPPFHLGNTTMGYGLGTAGASAFNINSDKPAIAIMGDGGFWHNGLTSGVGNAVYNKNDGLTIVVDNNYSAATGGQDLLSSTAGNRNRSTQHPIEKAARGVGVDWVKTVRTYDIGEMRAALKEAVTRKGTGPKVLVAQSECMLNRQRREKPAFAHAVAEGRRMIQERFGVDDDTCTGDHACMRLSGCPSLTIRPNPDPLKTQPVSYVDNSCVGCGNCGEVAHEAVLCPSFYKGTVIHNPGALDRWLWGFRSALIGWLQRRAERRRMKAA
ncbi:MAG: indolepyruvate ferredoxin oxidoreductase subunit alpha, partial [Gammaproteobacteria bacterium]|nr:indolepyruvate ferredoxin oxidoreductase subunit alpha [Gammaproteobacteria bacterium]